MESSLFEQSCKPGNEDYWRKIYRKGLEPAIENFIKRGLLHTAKWLSELFYVLRDVEVDEEEAPIPVPEDACYYMSKCYFDLKEYDRCIFFAEKGTSPCVKFLRFYAKYLALEKKRVEDMIEPVYSLVNHQPLNQLRAEMEEERVRNGFDGYMAYLYGIVCKKLELKNDAIEAFCEAVRKEPLHWGAWGELGFSIDDVRQAKNLDVPHDHWMKQFFLATLYVECQSNLAAIQYLTMLKSRGLEEFRFIRAQLAIAYHNHRLVDQSIEEFVELHLMDPYRLENLDIYSNVLYIKDERTALSHLAHRACEIDKYREETCCIVGNLYSLRAEHQKAVVYFQRALKINPSYLSAWTLMGHEYMEMKNSSAAIQSYRHALEANKRDYRAWYGLGQTYEILRMPSYGLHYYQQAHMRRPNDSRMLCAIGDTLERLGQNNNAIRSYKMARNLGDGEGLSLIKLAKLMQKLGQSDTAAMLYKEYALESERKDLSDKSEIYRSYKFLASYYLRKQLYNEAYTYAKKCLSYDEIKEEAKAILAEIAEAQKPEKGGSPMEEDSEIVEIEREGEAESETAPTTAGAFGTARRLWNSPASSGGDSTSDNL